MAQVRSAQLAAPYLKIGKDARVEVVDASGFRKEGIDRLVRQTVFGQPDEQTLARWLVWEAAHELGIRSASIHELYMARGQGKVSGFTVPAMNIRGMTYDMARAAIRAAHKRDVGAFVFEIARSEMEYTAQQPAEYATSVLAAAIREGHEGPLFIQGDHFQFKASKWKQDPKGTLKGIEDLTAAALEAGFQNIDIDASTLVDLDQPTVAKQQEVNADLTARMTAFIRAREPNGVTVSVGGEIGEVGKKNSTEEELRAYLDALTRKLKDMAPKAATISKVSIQTGTSHGGVVLPDGTVKEVEVDFDTLRRLSAVCVDEYGLAGCVQHGASTLPDDLFHKFPESETAEIHLATGFQNALLDHDAFPEDLTRQIHAHLDKAHADERKADWTNEQFRYKTRKKSFGPFKRQMWDMPTDAKNQLMAHLEGRFGFLYDQLRVGDTRQTVQKHVSAVVVHLAPPEGWKSLVDGAA